MNLKVVILAAGKGTRMRSSLPKVLHPIAGKAMVSHVLDTARSLEAEKNIVVVGHGAEAVQETVTADDVSCVLQAEQLGTGHAVQQALPALSNEDVVLILYGDVPLTQKETLQRLLSVVDATTIGLLTVNMDDPTGYGRIVRNSNHCVTGIVEEKDASDAIREINEVNTGILALNGELLASLLSEINCDNAQGEYYLTDIFSLANARGISIETCQPAAEWEVSGVNNRMQLAELERIHQANVAYSLMENGASLADPSRIDVRGVLNTGQDVSIDVNCLFFGDVSLGNNVEIGPNCVIINSRIADGTQILANSVIEEADIAANCNIGPFARIRPATELGEGAKVGNFVEVKKARVGAGSKINHLTYVGDAVIGESSNIGAGTITCNYDGVNKSQTIIGDGVFIGSNSSLVAPVEIENGATVGAGSTITKQVAKDQLAVARGKQMNLDNWARPTKK